jgi:hypothetical protein
MLTGVIKKLYENNMIFILIQIILDEILLLV